MKKNLFAFLAVLLIGLITLSAQSHQQPTASSQDVLPGARKMVMAAHYPSLQAAIDALPKQGGVVKLPPGEFAITAPLVVRGEDVTLEGCGTSTHLVNRNEDGAAAILLQPAMFPKNNRARIWRIRLADMRITGNPKSGHGIDARGVNELFLDGITVSNHGGDGIRLDNCYEDPRVADCLITYNKATGLNLIACHDIIVSANQFEENKDGLHCIDSFNLTMSGNNLDDHLGHGVVVENTYGSIISANMIEECNGAAIILDRDCYGIAISANVIAHNHAGIQLRDAHGCSVSANAFTIMKTDALRIGPASGRIAVTGNSFSDSYLGEGKIRRQANDRLAAGVVLQGARDVVLSGNQFSGLRPKAFSTDAKTQRVIFANNVLTETESDHSKLKKSVVSDNLHE